MHGRKGRGAALVNWLWPQHRRLGRMGSDGASLAVLIGTAMPFLRNVLSGEVEKVHEGRRTGKGRREAGPSSRTASYAAGQSNRPLAWASMV